MINTTQERLTQGWKLPKLVKLTAIGKDQWLWHHQLHDLVISTVWVYYLHMSNLQISIYLFKVILWLERELISFKSPLLSDTSDQKHTCLLFYCRQYENSEIRTHRDSSPNRCVSGVVSNYTYEVLSQCCRQTHTHTPKNGQVLTRKPLTGG